MASVDGRWGFELPTGRQGATNSDIDFTGFFGENFPQTAPLAFQGATNSWARPSEAARPHKLVLVRRVPGEFSHYDKRNPVRISTGFRILDDPRGVTAASAVAKLDAELQR